MIIIVTKWRLKVASVTNENESIVMVVVSRLYVVEFGCHIDMFNGIAKLYDFDPSYSSRC